jgi:hypothetical protein
METRNFLEEFVKDDNVVEFTIKYKLSTNYGFYIEDILNQLPKNVKDEAELLEKIKEFIMKSEFVKEIDEFNTLNEISSVDFN